MTYDEAMDRLFSMSPDDLSWSILIEAIDDHVSELKAENDRLRSIIACDICESRPCQCAELARIAEEEMQGFSP